MDNITVDLSGIDGLMDWPSKDTDILTPQPHTILATEGSKMAAGIFNPAFRSGYLAPAFSTNTSISRGRHITRSHAHRHRICGTDVVQIMTHRCHV